MAEERTLSERLERAGQEWLLSHLERLDDARREELRQQLAGVDLEIVAELRAGRGLAEPPKGPFEPAPYVALAERTPEGEAARRGLDDLRAGRVAFALLAGGQASRLQWDGPKGTYPIGPATDRSLFRILVEKVLRGGKDHGVVPRLAVTTSPGTDAAIRAFFQRNALFGLDRSRLHFSCQGSLPALDEEGRLILARPGRVFLSPDGHGGAVLALEKSGVLAEWEAAGITSVCTFQVDNPLLRVLDPDFLGRLSDGAPVATKIVEKRDPAEKVGVVVRAGGRPALVEYSEISKEEAEARDPDGRLTFRLGSIAVHVFSLAFLRRALATPLPLHRARKEIPSVDEGGNAQRTTGYKYERFLFDLFPRAERVTAVEVDREREYAPLKNASGPDSPETVRAALVAEYVRWHREAGVPPPEGVPEYSPLDVDGPADLVPRTAV